MFYAHNLNNHTISLKNLVLLFLTIVFGFGSVIVLAQLTIDTDISNARQTIAKITITDDGQETTPRLEFSATGIFIDSDILTQQLTFSGKVLGIDDNGNLIYTPSQGLVVSGVGTAGGSELRDEAGSDVYRYTGNVGIGTATMSGKLHLLGSGTTEVYIQETNPANAANINFKTTQQRWMLGGFNEKFYIGLSGSAFLNITTGGFVGIGGITPSVALEVNGSFMAGSSSSINGNNSSIAGGQLNHSTGLNTFIGGGNGNNISGDYSVIVGGQNGSNITNSNTSFIGNGSKNIIDNSDYSFIGGGGGNNIINAISTSDYSFIGGGNSNEIRNSPYSVIPGGQGNNITNAKNSFAGGQSAFANYAYTFIRNSDDIDTFSSTKTGQFLINVPFVRGVNGKGGVGINTPNPQAALDVSGDIRSNSLQLSPSNINTGISCTNPGMIIYKGSSFYGCDGSDRKKLDN